jgi:hypothetical protein
MFPDIQRLKNNADYYCEKVNGTMGVRSLKIPEDVVASLCIPPGGLED